MHDIGNMLATHLCSPLKVSLSLLDSVFSVSMLDLITDMLSMTLAILYADCKVETTVWKATKEYRHRSFGIFGKDCL